MHTLKDVARTKKNVVVRDSSEVFLSNMIHTQVACNFPAGLNVKAMIETSTYSTIDVYIPDSYDVRNVFK